MKIPRWLKWVGLFLTCGIFAIGIASIFADFGVSGPGMVNQTVVFADEGAVTITKGSRSPTWWLHLGRPSLSCYSCLVPSVILPRPHIAYPLEIRIPLLTLLLMAAIPTAYLWWTDRHIPSGCCQTCGYNLTGNVSGICPECGTACKPLDAA